ncbi:glycosyltransferase family 4 protein [candidate division WWE3 bacterium]|nr:glycosyltransferase family 4 protein [candidate division WWE3 bacterium]
MRILRIIYDWPQPWSGLAPAPYELTKAQIKLGHTFDVFCGRWPSVPMERLEGADMHPFLREPFSGGIFVTTSPFMFAYYVSWRGRNAVDIIHVHGHFGFWIFAYRWLLKRFSPNSDELKTPTVVHFHNTFKGRWKKIVSDGEKPNLLSRYFSWPLGLLSDKLAVQTASALVFVSDDLKKEAIEYYGADPNKCFVVESGVNPEVFVPVNPQERDKTRRDMGWDYDDRVILNLGKQVKRKNIHLLIETLSHLPFHYKLLLVGPMDYQYGITLETLITEKGLRKRIIRVGETPYNQTPIAYQMSDIFVLPSKFEGFPKVVLEAMACGVPVLASGFKAEKELKGLHYLEDLTPQSIAEKIRELVEAREHTDRDRVVSEYSWDVKARQLEKVYEYAKGSN